MISFEITIRRLRRRTSGNCGISRCPGAQD